VDWEKTPDFDIQERILEPLVDYTMQWTAPPDAESQILALMFQDLKNKVNFVTYSAAIEEILPIYLLGSVTAIDLSIKAPQVCIIAASPTDMENLSEV
jgi:hypothetical protein